MSRLENNGTSNNWINSDINQGKYIHSGVIRQPSEIIDSIVDMTKPVVHVDSKDHEHRSTSKKEKKRHKQEKVKKSRKKEKKGKKSKKRRRENKSVENSSAKHFNPILQLLSVRIV